MILPAPIATFLLSCTLFCIPHRNATVTVAQPSAAATVAGQNGARSFNFSVGPWHMRIHRAQTQRTRESWIQFNGQIFLLRFSFWAMDAQRSTPDQNLPDGTFREAPWQNDTARAN